MKRNPHRCSNWKGGRFVHDGYVLLYKPSHPNSNAKGYIREHRWVMSRHLGRPLRRSELVHHKNEITTDNRIRNLQLCTHAGHMTLHKSHAVCRICGKPQRCKNLCGKHYTQMVSEKVKCARCGKQITKSAKVVQPQRCKRCYKRERLNAAKAKRCSLCGAPHKSLGFCLEHYRTLIRNPRRRLRE